MAIARFGKAPARPPLLPIHIMMLPLFASSRFRSFVEIVLIFVVFFVQGAWPVPDVNESHYLAKAIHYWNPDWLRGDFFMESADTHQVFYFTLGWLSLYLSPTALAWTGRAVTWFLLAWAWRRLSVAIVPRAWYAVLTAALFACLMERGHMAGEWVVGGVEAKGFAYAIVLFGLGFLVRNRWNQALALFGAAGAFHALVGGWAAVASGAAWLKLRASSSGRPASLSPATPEEASFAAETPRLRSLWVGLAGGFLLSLPGLAPSLFLNWGADPALVRQSHQIYVFERLPHHLTLTGMRSDFILRMALLVMGWILLGIWEQRHLRSVKRIAARDFSVPWSNVGRLRAFVAGTLAIALAGAVVNSIMLVDRALAADALRYYWFRWTDVALPMGLALEGMALVSSVLAVRSDERPQRRLPASSVAARLGLAAAVVAAALHVGGHAVERLAPAAPRSDRLADYEAWREACRWVSQPENVPPGARFLTPRLAQTFKWYTGHSDVATWKDVPQDAVEIVEWWRRIGELHLTGMEPPAPRWRTSLSSLGAARIRQLADKYGAGYLIAQADDPLLDLPVIYRNRGYVVYRIRD